MIEKTYEAASLEPRIAERWEEAGAFRAGAGAGEGAETYSIVIPPPNVTGSLHMGHALNDTLQDILVRFERMRGKNVLWQVGLDHAGIATQMVVERQLMERQEPDRRAMGREAFVERIWKWKAESGGAILHQLRRLGASCDWSRERFTMDEGLSEAVLHVFVELYRQGLIYKDKRLVNWDPVFQTAISDLEVEQREVDGHMWHFKYPLAGGETYEYVERDANGNVTLRETRDYISIATTRPETMLGDGAVAVHPEDERYRPIVGRLCEIPVGPKRHRRQIPIITDEYPDPDFGSGAVKITGAHDFNDYEVARRNSIPLYRLMDARARMRDDGAPYAEAAAKAAEIVRSGEAPVAAVVDEVNLVPDEYRGLDRYEARERVVAEIDAEHLMIRVESKPIAQPFGDRSGAVIEPMLTDQWYVDAKTLAGPAIASVREGRTVFVPKNWEKTYYDWMENIQPWCISRQLWWGHRIPAWYGPSVLETPNGPRIDSGSGTRSIFVDKDVDGALAQARSHYANPKIVVVEDEQAAKRHQALDDSEKQVAIWRDEDVLDTWFSSALWPFSTLGWPEKTPELAAYYPTSVLVTGFDIIFFWVARMMMMGLKFMDEEPFSTVYVHALVRDKSGAKMSKSKGNVVDPLDLIEEFGADALRFTLAVMAAQGRDVKLDTQRIAGYRNFGTKLWNATRFAEMNGAIHGVEVDPASLRLPLNRWLMTELGATVAEAETALGAYRFNDAAAALYRFVWNLFCDWYVELSKPILTGGDEEAKRETRLVTGHVLDRIYALLHPFMPFVTEELWKVTERAEAPRVSLLCHASWPRADFADSQAAEDIRWLIAVVSEIRSVRAEMNVPPAAEAALLAIEPDEATAARIERHRASLQRLARLSSIEVGRRSPGQAAQIFAAGASFALPLAGMIDIEAERARLEKADAKARAEIERIDRKLGNAKFVANAPEEIVEQEREKRQGYQNEVEKLQAGLGRLR